ncbi:paramecium surface antigen repeat-containing protein [Tieghemostelium lacteum]|uniref:Paramecium surface antigen repeat-containing protein n=1 Tax=Tieghemostelium lacteum TaxID=361077 RepID=A0A152A9X8_TIELA|nr:paramecium surface antigen repeat-containing protein [Tieghemostelium lacteum]|eukprot:KYR03014.1 paramecium surface antigen repeat-containing protein [Tieghemostelium lacteum]
MKCALIILIFISIYLDIAVSQQYCDVVGACVEENGKCTGDGYLSNFLDNPLSFRSYDLNLLMCGSGLYCRYINDEYGFCAPVAAIGENCDEHSNCYNGAYCYHPTNLVSSPNTCQWAPYLTLNQSCETTLQCVEGLECDITEGICVVVPLSSDITCSSPNQCLSTQYCNNEGSCVDLIPDNGDCTDPELLPCVPTSYCTPVTGGGLKCIPAYSLSENAPCETTKVCDISQSLYCSIGTAKCTKIEFTPSDTNCTNSNCNIFESCQCNGDDTSLGSCKSFFFKNPSECKASSVALLQCLSTNKCPSLFNQYINPLAPGACGYSNCASEFCDYVTNCIQQGEGCNIDPLAGTICTASSSSFLSVSIPIVVLALLVSFIF